MAGRQPWDRPKALLAHSCTAALEMAAILADVGPGDEVIMPSFTFVSTANAFVLRGAVPVFVDIRPDSLNLDERLVEAAITEKNQGDRGGALCRAAL
ncbi:TDP-4-oxo-6-deoxy-D-glucose transaminase [Pseudomonas putida S11]|nr:TDP-4-oxo-6-deoxy-D-glucose transaminase [Pseudomonas putida S11]